MGSETGLVSMGVPRKLCSGMEVPGVEGGVGLGAGANVVVSPAV